MGSSISQVEEGQSWAQRRSFGTQLAWVLALVVALLALTFTIGLTVMMRGQIERTRAPHLHRLAEA